MATEVTGLRRHSLPAVARWPAVALLLSGLLLAALPACAGEAPPAAPPTPASIKARGELRVATLNSPTVYYLGTHGPEGLEFQLASQFARSLGVRLQVVQLDSRAALRSALAEGRADLAAAQLTWGPEWREAGIAAAALRPGRPVLGLPSWSPETFRTRRSRRARIVVMEDSAEAAFLESWSAAAKVDLEWVVIPRAGGIDSLDAVAGGSADVALIDGNEFAFARPAASRKSASRSRCPASGPCSGSCRAAPTSCARRSMAGSNANGAPAGWPRPVAARCSRPRRCAG